MITDVGKLEMIIPGKQRTLFKVETSQIASYKRLKVIIEVGKSDSYAGGMTDKAH